MLTELSYHKLIVVVFDVFYYLFFIVMPCLLMYLH